MGHLCKEKKELNKDEHQISSMPNVMFCIALLTNRMTTWITSGGHEGFTAWTHLQHGPYLTVKTSCSECGEVPNV